MPDLNVMIGVLPLWAVALLLIFLIAVCVMALRRSGSPGSIAALFGVPALIVIAWAAWTLADGAMIRQRTAEREALNARALQLISAATTPGSALACLDGGAGDAVEAACEAALFAKPETVAAATAYVEARLRLLADSLDYARRADWTFAATWAQLRSGLEADRYGFVAHVLAQRDGCTAESCSAFALLRDASTVKTHLSERTLDNNVARYAANWGRPGSAPVAAAPPTVGLAPPLPSGAATLLGVPVTRPIDFPSAASIPPVSIMTEPPPAPAPAPKPGALSGRPQ
jgi:hypothetical protein